MSDVPPGSAIEEAVETTDGRRTWLAGELRDVAEASAADPTWLQMRASINAFLQGQGEPDRSSG